ncbi:DotU family type IV/VI secretion system protein [Pseudomonas syringae]|nr:DotU family type IV/VI secretion system protein [Pseudomonas syringae]MBD8792837.1 DotU family type IV/VI secretion system protein [Pseudomonas syringae]MBD8803340.1 DotU family type IV/VI secretion system protein [Pseudomonas syringae]MBD8811937.1 DotU family type IV/VI secretion system protein [Pseudomonas syringae]
MTKQDPPVPVDMTVLLDPSGVGPDQAAMTTASDAPRFGRLEERMVYTAQQPVMHPFSLSLNDLVGAASPLLSSIRQIKYHRDGQGIDVLNQQLRVQVRQFDYQALRSGIDSDQVGIARYVLCTVLDEAVVTTSWGEQSDWAQDSLLSHFHNETFGGEKFFSLLEQLSKNPVRHLPLLELMYVCLALGFEGKYRRGTRGTVALQEIRDALYRQIRQLRGDASSELSPCWQGLKPPRRDTPSIVPGWLVVLFTGVALIMMYSGFAWVLGEQRQTVLQPWQQLETSLIVPRS